jgi:hypothetical protein
VGHGANQFDGRREFLISSKKDPIQSAFDLQTTLQPKEFAVFNFQVRTGFEEGYFSGELMVRTKFDTLLLPFRLKVSKGQLSLDPKTIVFDSAFPVIIFHNQQGNSKINNL